MKLSRLLLALLIVLPALSPSNGLLAAESPSVKKGAVTVTLVSDVAAIESGKSFTLALRMQHEPHWHSYWIAPGTGFPTALTWTLPAGFKAGAIQWPTPHVVQDTAGKITGNGYIDENFLLLEITAPAGLTPGATLTFSAAAEWLMCKDVCMPGDAKLEIAFPVVTGSAPADSKWTGAIAATRRQLPKPATGWTVTASHTDKTATLRLTPQPGTKHQPADLHFFAADGLTDYSQANTVTQDKGTWVITAPLDPAADKNATKLTGVLASANGWSDGSGYDGLNIDVTFSGNQSAAVSQSSLPGFRASENPGQTPGGQQAATGNPQPPAAAGSLLGTLLLAFVGGMILNLMPCVFPVLGIKILGFVNQSGNDRKKITAHGLVFALGVLISFWTLAGVLLVLRAGGSQLGWGFQLQSPAFVFGMAVFMLIFALNMSGLFEIGLSATGVGGDLQMKEGFSGSFFTGALATLVATPCSAPFLAPALGAALSLSALESIMIFTAIAIGLALPYLLLSIFPQAIKMLPKPGAWMETFKQFMAFPLYATVGWLLWVLAGQTRDDDNALLLIAFGFVLVAMATWAYGRFGQAHGKPKRQMFGRVFAAVLLAGGLYTGWPKSVEAGPAGTYQVTWEKWSPEAITTAQAAGKFVYVDFTARWCATCQTNKAAVFHDQAVLAELQRKNVVLLRGDWTNRDPKITAELARWNRSAVPFNLIYAPGKPDPVVLPELLTAGKVLEAFAQAAAK
jgi:thiol:disulfide interchange protein DsbD